MEQELNDLRSELQTLRTEIDAQNRENEKKMQALASVNDAQQQEPHFLRILATVGLCISILAAVGNIVLLILYIRKKVGLQTVTK